MNKVCDLEKITLGEAFYLNYFYDVNLTVKNGQVILSKGNKENVVNE